MPEQTAGRRYALYDVFTQEPLAGNPLAVVFDAEGLSDEAMQRIAGEFNLSETVFVSAPKAEQHAASLRIFTPARELPFAGHPTVGAAIALTDGSADDETRILILEERIGPVRCAVRQGFEGAFAEFDVPGLPSRLPLELDVAALAAALGIAGPEIGFENHFVAAWTAGVPFIMVPVANLDVAGRARFDAAAWRELASSGEASVPDIYLYCRECVRHDASFHARMFAPGMGIGEDPATGSAAAALAGAIAAFDAPGEGRHAYTIEQGVEMGRPSYIRLNLETGAAGEITAARIGGQAVRVARGTLL